MGDTFKKTMNVLLTFFDGEGAPARKFSAISSQLQRVAEKLEGAIGDIRDESWPYSSLTNNRLSIPWGKHRSTGAALGNPEGRILGIANLARLIGPAANLNPKTLDTSSEIEQTYTSGVHEFSLRWKPDDAQAVVFADTDAAVFVTFVDEDTLAQDGDYHVTSDGKVFCFRATGGGTATYTTTSTEYAGGHNYSGARFNVIPDPNQAQSGVYALTIGALDGSGKRLVTLPLINAQQSNHHQTSAELGVSDYNYDLQAKLPLVLTDSLTAGENIPTGFMFLRNNTTNRTYDRATYEYVNETSFYISNVDLEDDINAGHEFCVYTVGTDITTSIDDLRNKHYHSHDRALGEPFVNIQGISGAIAQPGNSGAWVPSNIPGNYFPQYLHRDGYRTGYDDTNGNDGNAIRGDLAVALSDKTPGAGIETGLITDPTYKVFFGTPLNYIYDDGSQMVYSTQLSTHPHYFENGFVKVETGFLGTVGTSSNAAKCWVGSGTLTVESNGSIDLTTLGFDAATHEVYAYDLLVQVQVGSFFLPANWTDSIGRHFQTSLSNDGSVLLINYYPQDVGAETGSREYRLQVWYK